MTSKDIAAEIRAYVVAEYLAGEDASDLTGDYALIDNGVIDSLGLIRLISHLTETYQVSFDDIEFGPDNFRSLDAIVELVKTNSAATTAA
ncbi:acyl carrier protein [Kribbella antibiotica]|uniref:Acyl carrier protein n=1 Tax=Kribbella antibiotica TaxID=190195 RepID=A0A4R4YIW5_9ACTN|nr:acyl carrier protein [Kribbella antibiotica]TDD44803.1 acyl carrier protein [Kribbella antibiotica]